MFTLPIKLRLMLELWRFPKRWIYKVSWELQSKRIEFHLQTLSSFNNLSGGWEKIDERHHAERENRKESGNCCGRRLINWLQGCLTFLECTRAVILLHHTPEKKNRTNWFWERKKASFLHILCSNKLRFDESNYAVLFLLNQMNVKGHRTWKVLAGRLSFLSEFLDDKSWWISRKCWNDKLWILISRSIHRDEPQRSRSSRKGSRFKPRLLCSFEPSGSMHDST